MPGLVGGGLQAPGEEAHPAIPIAVRGDAHQASEIVGAVALEPGRYRQGRFRQDAGVVQLDDDEEAPHASVAIMERMQRLELVVGQRASHHWVESATVVG